MAKLKPSVEPEVSNAEFTKRQQDAQSRVDLDGVIEETEASLSLKDFEPASLVRAGSFDPTSKRGSDLWIIAMNAVHGDLVGRGKFEAEIVDWVCFQKDVIRPNGEYSQDAWVCVFFLVDGARLSTASLLTCKQWANVVKVKGKGPYNPPLRVVFAPNPSKIKGGNPWYSILPIGESSETPSTESR